MASEIIWRGNLREGLAGFNALMSKRLSAVTHYTAVSMEGYARTHAPWKDQTGNARNGLRGTTDIVPLHHYAAVLSHSVPYGIWLEVRWAGRYSIILPTIRNQTPQVAAMLQGLIGRSV